MSDKQIPRRTTVREAILAKAEKLEGLDKETLKVSIDRLLCCWCTNHWP